jgi:hypothetical protein
MILWKNTNTQPKTLHIKPISFDALTYLNTAQWYKYRAEVNVSSDSDLSYVVNQGILLVIYQNSVYFRRFSLLIEKELMTIGFRFNASLTQFAQSLMYEYADANKIHTNIFPSDISKHFVKQNSNRIQERVNQWKLATY